MIWDMAESQDAPFPRHTPHLLTTICPARGHEKWFQVSLTSSQLPGPAVFPGLSPESSAHRLLSHHLLPLPVRWSTFPGQIPTPLNRSYNCCPYQLAGFPRMAQLPLQTSCAPGSQAGVGDSPAPCRLLLPTPPRKHSPSSLGLSHQYTPSHQAAIGFFIGKNILLIPTLLLVSAPFPFFA